MLNCGYQFGGIVEQVGAAKEWLNPKRLLILAYGKSANPASRCF
jgi:hypothetical protein